MKNIFKIIVVLIVALNAVSFDLSMIGLEHISLRLDRLEAMASLDDERYLGSGWAPGYTWSLQPILSSTSYTISVGGAVTFGSDGVVEVSASISQAEQTQWDWIHCCNPTTNDESWCWFGDQDNNCIRG